MRDAGRSDWDAHAGALAHALESLDETTRLVLALLHVERLTVEETAQALGLEASQVDGAATLARAGLAACVQPHARRAS